MATIRKRKWRKGERKGEVFFYIVLILNVFLAVFPIFWVVLTSFKTEGQLFRAIPLFIFSPTFENYHWLFRTADFIRCYTNTLIIGFSSIAIIVLVGSLAGYALARFPVFRKEDVAFFILSQRMMPPIAIIIPLYLLFFNLHILDTYRGIILIYTAFNLPIAIWIMRGFFEAIPVEIEESALIDGASTLGVFFRIALPLARSGLISCAAFCFFMCINEFFFAFILAPTRVRPVSVAVTLFLPTGVRGTMYGQACAAALLIMAPGIIICLLTQRYLVRGMTFGALKY